MPFYYLLSKLCKLRRDFIGSVISVLDRELVERELTGFTKRNRVYTTWVTIVIYLSQVATRCSCRRIVSSAINHKVIPSTCSSDDSAYCNRRKVLPEQGLMKLAFEVGRRLSLKVRKSEMLFNRRVKVVDGTSFHIPDTPSNRSEYPYSTRQKEGCGTPVMYVSALMDLSTGAMIRAETIGKSGYELKLFRRLWRWIKKGEIILGDAAYMTYGIIAGLLDRSVDCVFCWNNRRHHKPKVKKLGVNDWLEEWDKPVKEESWIKSNQPEKLTVRVIKFIWEADGFRSKPKELVTSLLDPKIYPKEKIIELYYRRWEQEIRFDDIKTSMKLADLTCKTPERCRSELWMGLLAYNLIRTVMLDSAKNYKLNICRLSFLGTMDRIIEMASGKLFHNDPGYAYDLTLKHIADDALPYRPGRYEPRRVKRRRTKYSFLTTTRKVAREARCNS